MILCVYVVHNCSAACHLCNEAPIGYTSLTPSMYDIMLSFIDQTAAGPHVQLLSMLILTIMYNGNQTNRFKKDLGFSF